MAAMSLADYKSAVMAVVEAGTLTQAEGDQLSELIAKYDLTDLEVTVAHREAAAWYWTEHGDSIEQSEVAERRSRLHYFLGLSDGAGITAQRRRNTGVGPAPVLSRVSLGLELMRATILVGFIGFTIYSCNRFFGQSESKPTQPVAQLSKEDQEWSAKFGPKPEPSQWDGISAPVNEYLRRTLNDYKSLEIVEASVVSRNEKGWMQRLKYRAANAFGGKVLAETIFIINGGQVIEVLTSE